MKREKKKRLHPGRCLRLGLQIGLILAGAAATVGICVIGWQTYRARTGSPGGELLLLPMILLMFYAGWVACRDWEAYKRKEGGLQRDRRDGQRREERSLAPSRPRNGQGRME